MHLLRLQVGPHNHTCLNAQRYQQEVLDAALIPHFDNHPLTTRPIFLDDKARTHLGRAVIAHHRDVTMASKEC